MMFFVCLSYKKIREKSCVIRANVCIFVLQDNFKYA